jgi:hypothetical protein
MHHLNELGRKRPLYLHLLTPEDVAPPVQKSFIITKHQYGDAVESSNFIPLLPISRSKQVQPQGLEQEKSIEDILMEKRRERFKAKIAGRRIIFKEGCPTCGQDHISVQYYGYRHICLRCREYIKTTDGHPVKIMLDKEENIIALTYDDRKQVKYVDFQKLVIFDKECYASFAGPGELIVLLYDEGLTY